MDMDSIEAALMVHNKNPLVLNFADDVFPGGHVAMGSGAQEESLYRRTNYFTTLGHFTGFYPLEGTDVVYSSDVLVIKDLEFNLLKDFKPLCFIACPGLRHPSLLAGDKLRTTDRELLKKRIETIFQVGYIYGHDALVLGALGCGAWNSPPEEVARVFKEVCEAWDGVFSTIIFPCFRVDTKDYIVKTRNSMKGICNFEVFSSVVGSGFALGKERAMHGEVVM